jgi:modulator of FtsH protease
MSEAENWKDFYVMAGGAAAALTGLILVAVSLHLRPILSHPLYRDRSFTSLQGLVTMLIVACIALSPQDLTAMGVEILVLGLYWLVRGVRFIRLFLSVARERRSAAGPRTLLWSLEWLFWSAWIVVLVLGGALLIAGDGRALAALAVWYAAGFVLIVWNAWVLIAEVAALPEG